MSITIPATGSGDTAPVVATEVISAQHYQLVKLIDGNVGSLAPIGTTGNPLDTFNVGGSMTAFQGGAPWSVTGSVYATGSVNATVLGNVAHDAADAGNPVKVGGFTIVNSWPSKVGSGDRSNFISDELGRQVIVGVPLGITQNKQNAFTGVISGTVVWSPAPNGVINITMARIMAGSATAGMVALYFAASGAPINFVAGTGTCVFQAEMAPSTTAKPGVVIPFGLNPCRGAANDALRLYLSSAMQVYVQVDGYETQ